jgi:hypothetical protein
VTAADALATLRTAGLAVSADDRGLILQPKERLTPELVALARAHKPELLVLLAPNAWTTAYAGLVPPGVCLDCGGPAPRDGRHWCAACERQGVVRDADRCNARRLDDDCDTVSQE